MGRAAPPPSPTVLDNSRASLGWQRGGACNLVPDGPSRCLDDRDGRECERVLTLQSKAITKHALTLRLLNNSDRWSHFPYWKAENNYLANIFWKITKDLSLGTTGVNIHSFFFFPLPNLGIIQLLKVMFYLIKCWITLQTQRHQTELLSPETCTWCTSWMLEQSEQSCRSAVFCQIYLHPGQYTTIW